LIASAKLLLTEALVLEIAMVSRVGGDVLVLLTGNSRAILRRNFRAISVECRAVIAG
jgi:hypothetical protein